MVNIKGYGAVSYHRRKSTGASSCTSFTENYYCSAKVEEQFYQIFTEIYSVKSDLQFKNNNNNKHWALFPLLPYQSARSTTNYAELLHISFVATDVSTEPTTFDCN
jgi:hypothetical protein